MLAVAGVEAAQLGGRVVANQALSIGRPLERVIVDHDQAAVRREMDVAFDEIAPGGDRRTKGADRVFGMLGGVATMSADQGTAVVMRSLVASTDRLSQGAGKSNCARQAFW